jgi:hypothetical protein
LGYLKETINGDDTMGEVIELGTIYGEYFENLLMKQRKSESRDYVLEEFRWQLDGVDRGDDCDYTFRDAGDYDTAWEDALDRIEDWAADEGYSAVTQWLRNFAHRHGFVEDVTPSKTFFMSSYDHCWRRGGKMWCFDWPDMNEVID